MVKIVCQNGILCTATVRIRFLVTDEDVKRFFFLRDSEDAFLDLVDRVRFFLIDCTLIPIRVLQRGLVVLIVED